MFAWRQMTITPFSTTINSPLPFGVIFATQFPRQEFAARKDFSISSTAG
jgi:hypothetical protein